MASSIQITLSDANYAGATEVQNDLRTSGTSGHETLRRLSGYFDERRRSSESALVGKIAVSGTAPVRAVGTLTFTGQPSVGDTMRLGSTTMTCVSSGASASSLEFNLGASAGLTIDNLDTQLTAVTAINNAFEISNTATTLVVTCRQPGVLGNMVTFTEALDNATADGSGNLGGTTAGAGVDDTSPLDFAGDNGGTPF